MFLLAAHPGATRKFHEHVARMMDRLSEAQIGTRVARSPKELLRSTQAGMLTAFLKLVRLDFH
jgi:hypothetical protein